VKTIRLFLEALQRSQYNDNSNATLELQVKYEWEKEHCRGWPLPRGDYLVDDGVLDPGFSSGPVDYDEIESIRVMANPQHDYGPQSLQSYESKYKSFKDSVFALKDIHISDEYVGWRRGA